MKKTSSGHHLFLRFTWECDQGSQLASTAVCAQKRQAPEHAAINPTTPILCLALKGGNTREQWEERYGALEKAYKELEISKTEANVEKMNTMLGTPDRERGVSKTAAGCWGRTRPHASSQV